MIRRLNPILGAILVVADAVALWAAFRATGAFRIALNQLLPNQFTHGLVESYFPPMPMVMLCWGATLFLTGAYDLLGKRGILQVAVETGKAVSLAMCLQVVVMFFFTRDIYSRSLLLLFWATSLVFLTTSREIAFFALRRLKLSGIAVPVAVVGTGVMGQLLARKLAADREPRFRFAGFLADEHSTESELEELDGQLLGHMEKAETLINEHGIRRLFVTSPDLDTMSTLSLILLSERLDIGLERVPDLYGLLARRVTMTEIDGVPLVSFRHVRFTRWEEAVKRTVDVALSSLGLIGLAPLLGLITLAMKLDSPGPVLFSQRRVGRGGKHFQLLKFRSMYEDAEGRRRELDAHNEASGHIFKMKNDPRVTRVGQMLRRWSVDELPQLVNVLLGDMSLVGPRPLPKDDVDEPHTLYEEWSLQRRSVRPGMTGLWQVSGRSQLPFEEMVRLDLHYINNWSLGLDLKLLVRTIPAVWRGHGAY